MYMYIYIYIPLYVYIYLHMHMHLHTHIFNLTHTQFCFHVFLYTRIHFLCGCMCLCMRVSLLRVWMETTLTHTNHHTYACVHVNTQPYTHTNAYMCMDTWAHATDLEEPARNRKNLTSCLFALLFYVVVGACCMYYCWLPDTVGEWGQSAGAHLHRFSYVVPLCIWL